MGHFWRNTLGVGGKNESIAIKVLQRYSSAEEHIVYASLNAQMSGESVTTESIGEGSENRG